MASWKIVPDTTEARSLVYAPFLTSRKFFAVDGSYSTGGRILELEKEFTCRFHEKYPNEHDLVCQWGTKCNDPSNRFDEPRRWNSDYGGTAPQIILRNSNALEAIHHSNVWFLVTDGEVPDNSVNELAVCAGETGVFQVPIVFVIVGRKRQAPSATDISVGISFVTAVQDALILFKDLDGALYLITGKGCFAPLAGGTTDFDLTSWDNLPCFAGEDDFFDQCRKHEIQVLAADCRSGLPKGISLGPEWESANGGPAWVDLDVLVNTGSLPDSDLDNVLAEEAVNVLGVAYKTRNRMDDLRRWLLGQKVEQVNPKLEDVAGAAHIISQLNAEGISEDSRRELQTKLRDAHAKNREHYRSSISNFASSPEVLAAKKRNRLVDEALQTLAGIEAAGYSADILSRRSNRARRAETVAGDSDIALDILDLDMPGYRASCQICCDDDVIMCICLKDIRFDGANTTDFVLNFPLAASAISENSDVISSQNICFQCAMMSPFKRSIYNEDVKVIIPLLSYDGTDDPSRAYIMTQLYLGLTDGLAIGAPLVSQLFMAILHNYLTTKQWAGAGLSGDQLASDQYAEERQRRNTLEWMRNQLLEKTISREDFGSTGRWVKFPEALRWMAKDFAENLMASKVVTYPVAGFDTLISLGEKTSAFSVENIHLMNIARAVYSITAKFLLDLQNNASSPQELWKQNYMKTLYREFNGPLIPKDLHGPQSLVTNVDAFFSHLSECFGRDDVKGIAQAFAWADNDTKVLLMRKIQLLLFWLVFRRTPPMKAQTYFGKLQDENPLASAVLDPKLSVPQSTIKEQLLSIFVGHEDNVYIDPEAMRMHTQACVPFATPFGPSILHCGAPACRKPFLTLELGTQFEAKHALTISSNRKEHFIQVFGIRNRFEHSANGLPERTEFGQSPASMHANYHANIVLAWAEGTVDERRRIVNDEAAREEFVGKVRARICGQGRGNVYDVMMDEDIRAYLPSLLKVLALALRMEGKDDKDVAVYEHDFDQNSLEAKARWEMRAMEFLGRAG